MENAIDFIIPINSKNAISRVVLTFILSQKIVKPKDFFEKLKNIRDFDSYQKKLMTNSQSINFNQNQVNIKNEGESGFIFERFDANGMSTDMLKIENKQTGQALISFESRSYISWELFLKSTISEANIIFNHIDNLYFDAISLNYLDEFIWKNDSSNIKVDAIFKQNSDLLNKKFFDSINGTFILINQEPKGGKVNYSEERTECTFNNTIKRIQINHIYALKFSESLKLESDTSNFINEQLDIAHRSNKELLEGLLTDEVLIKMGIKKGV